MRRTMMVASVLAAAAVAPASADPAEEGRADLTLSAGAGLLFGGNVRDGFGGVGQGNAGLLAGARAAWLPVTFFHFAVGPEAMVARWTTEVDASNGTLGLLGARLALLQGNVDLYISARGGMWIERMRGVLDSGFGGHTHLGKRLRLGWEVGACTWRETNYEFYPASFLRDEDKVYGAFRFVGAHGWFELAYAL